MNKAPNELLQGVYRMGMYGKQPCAGLCGSTGIVFEESEHKAGGVFVVAWCAGCYKVQNGVLSPETRLALDEKNHAEGVICL
jgi:hypothetical protein